MPDILDWHISDAPGADETPPGPGVPPPAPSPRRPLPPLSARSARRVTLTLGGVIVLTLLSIGVYWGWSRAQVQAAVEAVIAQETDARRRSDWPALRDLTAESDRKHWRTLYEVLPPLPYIGPAEAGRVRAVASVASDLVRAEVTYHYRAPDGTPLTFIRDQYYRYVNGAWKRTAPPTAVTQDKLDYYSFYFNASYATVDDAHLQPALREAEAQLARVCALWPCANVSEIRLAFSADSRLPAYPEYAASGESVLYQAMLNAGDYQTDLTWPAPYQSGYPADEVTAGWYRRILTLSLFQRFVNRLAYEHDLENRSVLARAMALRLASRLGLEPFPMQAVLVTHPNFAVSELWSGRTAEGGWANSRLWDSNLSLRAALVAINHLLSQHPPEVEDRLFAALLSAQDEVEWVARGLDIPEYEAYSRLAAVARPELPTVRVLTTQPERFILGCPGHLAAYSPGQAAPTPLLEGAYLSSQAHSWSPDHRRLLVEVNGQMGVVDFDSHMLAWLPLEADGDYFSLRWINDALIAFIEYDSGYYPTVRFFDITQPDRRMPVLEDASDYLPAPDSSRAVVVQPGRGSHNNRLSLVTTPDDTPQPLVEGSFLAWSPDSQAIAYIWYGQLPYEFAVRVLNLPTGDTREVVTNADLLRTVNDQIAVDYSPWATVQWLADGRRLAFSITASGASQSRSWVGMFDTASERPWEPPPAEMPEHSYPAGFSADGQWMALSVYGDVDMPEPQIVTHLYSMTTGERVRTFPGLYFLSWSPSGHQLALLADVGLYWLNEPDRLTEPLTPLTNSPCNTLTWWPSP